MDSRTIQESTQYLESLSKLIMTAISLNWFYGVLFSLGNMRIVLYGCICVF